ncbi:unnamed protein product, partial [Prorocentrum cordatum]
EVGDLSKPGDFDASVLLFLDRRVGLAQALLAMAAALCRAGAALALGLAKFTACHVHQLRHSGPSQLTDLEHIGRQGHWKSGSSVRGREKGGRLAELLRLLPAAQRRHAKACAMSLSQSRHGLPSPAAPVCLTRQ